MNDQNPAAVATRYFDALAAGDLATVTSLLNADLVWHQPGANRFSGTHTGLAGFEELIGGMMQVSGGTFQLSVTGTPMVNGDKVAVPVRFQAQREGHEMDMGGIDLLTVRDGSIVEVHLFSSDGPAEDRFWGSAA